MKCGFDPQYVLDEIEVYELNAALKYQYYAVKDDWEQARLIAYMIAQVNSKNRMRVQDIITFFWEEDEEEKGDTSISKEQIEMLKAQAQQYLKSQNKKVEKRND